MEVPLEAVHRVLLELYPEAPPFLAWRIRELPFGAPAGGADRALEGPQEWAAARHRFHWVIGPTALRRLVDTRVNAVVEMIASLRGGNSVRELHVLRILLTQLEDAQHVGHPCREAQATRGNYREQLRSTVVHPFRPFGAIAQRRRASTGRGAPVAFKQSGSHGRRRHGQGRGPASSLTRRSDRHRTARCYAGNEASRCDRGDERIRARPRDESPSEHIPRGVSQCSRELNCLCWSNVRRWRTDRDRGHGRWRRWRRRSRNGYRCRSASSLAGRRDRYRSASRDARDESAV